MSVCRGVIRQVKRIFKDFILALIWNQPINLTQLYITINKNSTSYLRWTENFDEYKQIHSNVSTLCLITLHFFLCLLIRWKSKMMANIDWIEGKFGFIQESLVTILLRAFPMLTILKCVPSQWNTYTHTHTQSIIFDEKPVWSPLRISPRHFVKIYSLQVERFTFFLEILSKTKKRLKHK